MEDWSIIYKIDVLDALKAAGYNTTKIRKEKIIGEATVQRIRKKEFVSWDVLAKLCQLLHCDVGDIIECRTSTGEPAPSNPELAKHFPPRDRSRKK